MAEKYAVREADHGLEYESSEYEGQIIDSPNTTNEYIRVVCVDKGDAEHIAKLLEANPFPE